MGATQLAQTPSGVPRAAPISVLPAGVLKRRRENSGSKVRAAAPKHTPKVMPIRLAHIQFMVVRPTRVAKGIAGETGSLASKVRAAVTLTERPEFSFFSRAG